MSELFQSGKIPRAARSAWAIRFRTLGALVALVVIALVVFVPPNSDVTDDSDFLAIAIARNSRPEGLTSEPSEPSQGQVQNTRASLHFGIHREVGTGRSRLCILTSCCLLRC